MGPRAMPGVQCFGARRRIFRTFENQLSRDRQHVQGRRDQRRRIYGRSEPYQEADVRRRSAAALGREISERSAIAALVLLGHSGFPQGVHAAGSRSCMALHADSHHEIPEYVLRQEHQGVDRKRVHRALVRAGATLPDAAAERRQAGEDAECHAVALAVTGTTGDRPHHAAVRAALTGRFSGTERIAELSAFVARIAELPAFPARIAERSAFVAPIAERVPTKYKASNEKGSGNIPEPFPLVGRDA